MEPGAYEPETMWKLCPGCLEVTTYRREDTIYCSECQLRIERFRKGAENGQRQREIDEQDGDLPTTDKQSEA